MTVQLLKLHRRVEQWQDARSVLMVGILDPTFSWLDGLDFSRYRVFDNED